jgi:hypothetical protein
MARKSVEISYSENNEWKTSIHLYHELLVTYFRLIESSKHDEVSDVEKVLEDLEKEYWQAVRNSEYRIGRVLFEEKKYPHLQLLRQKYRSTREKQLFNSWIVEESPHALQ